MVPRWPEEAVAVVRANSERMLQVRTRTETRHVGWMLEQYEEFADALKSNTTLNELDLSGTCWTVWCCCNG